jgi:DNA repair exonuclease SbcCD nuclease subunit
MSITKILVIGDPHFRKENIPEVNLLSEKVINIVKNNQYDAIIILGDFLETHEKLFMPAKTIAEIFMLNLSEILPTYVLIGNHDRISNKEFLTKEHPFICAEEIPGIHIIWKPEIHIINDLNFLFVPYVEPGRYYEAIKTINPDFSTITSVFSHQEFRGCKMDSDKISEKGDHWPLDYPLNISGHIHLYQQLQPNLIYPGTPMQQNFAEDLNKAISLFTFDSNGYTHERIELGLPKKITLYAKANEINDLKIDNINKYRIRITATLAETKTLVKTAIIKDLEKRGIKIEYETINDEVIVQVDKEKKVIVREKKQIKNYLIILKDRIKDNKLLTELYNEII